MTTRLNQPLIQHTRSLAAAALAILFACAPPVSLYGDEAPPAASAAPPPATPAPAAPAPAAAPQPAAPVQPALPLNELIDQQIGAALAAKGMAPAALADD